MSNVVVAILSLGKLASLPGAVWYMQDPLPVEGLRVLVNALSDHYNTDVESA